MHLNLRQLVFIFALGITGCDVSSPATTNAGPTPSGNSGTQTPGSSTGGAFSPGLQYNGAIAFEKAVTP